MEVNSTPEEDEDYHVFVTLWIISIALMIYGAIRQEGTRRLLLVLGGAYSLLLADILPRRSGAVLLILILWMTWEGRPDVQFHRHGGGGILDYLSRVGAPRSGATTTYGHLPEIRGSTPRERYKNFINGLSKKEFSNLRFYKVREERPQPHEVSRGHGKFLEMASHILHRLPERVRAVDLCAGSGGWTQAVKAARTKSEILAVTYGLKVPTHRPFELASVPGVDLIEADYRTVPVDKRDLVMFDGGEAHHDWKEEGDKFDGLVMGVLPWIRENPKCEFVIKILTPGTPGTMQLIRSIRRITGKGRLIRNPRSRNSNAECYLLSDAYEEDSNLESDIAEIYESIMENIKEGHAAGYLETYQRNALGPVLIKRPQPLPPMTLMEGFDPLEPLHMEASIERYLDGRRMHKARNINEFLKEIGYIVIAPSGDVATGVVNPFVDAIIGKLATAEPGILSWAGTMIGAGPTYSVVMRKVDAAPKEDHDLEDALWEAYEAIIDFIREKKLVLKRTERSEVKTLANKKAGMGKQENGKAATLGEYLDNGNWQEAMDEEFENLRNENPTLAVANTVGKGEKAMTHKSKGSRLIWFLPGTMRLMELEVFGGLNKILKKLPFSVSGMALMDYGEKLASISQGCGGYVCDDIAGWDTKISKKDLMREERFLRCITEDAEMKKDINLFYRLYANKCVAISRPGDVGDEMALYNVRGQRGSGESITYSMNTITNAAHILVRMCMAAGIRDIRKGSLNLLHGMDSKKVGTPFALISGDDSVVGGTADFAEKYAEIGGMFSSECGKPRKDQSPWAASPVTSRLEYVDFCSHQYRPISVGSSMRWMAVRPLHEILGKARMSLGVPDNRDDQEAWARATGFQLLMTYPHIPEVRRVALGILSATDTNLLLEGLGKPGRFRAEPWLLMKTANEAIRAAINGPSTNYPQNPPIQGLKDVGYTGSNVKMSLARRKWRREIMANVAGIRNFIRKERAKRYKPQPAYEDALHEHSPYLLYEMCDAIDVTHKFEASATRGR